MISNRHNFTVGSPKQTQIPCQIKVQALFLSHDAYEVSKYPTFKTKFSKIFTCTVRHVWNASTFQRKNYLHCPNVRKDLNPNHES